MIVVFSVCLLVALIGSGWLIKGYVDHLLERARGAEAKAAALSAQRDESGYAALVGRTIVVLTTERQSYRGVLANVYLDGLRLVSPALMQDAEPASLGGEIFIERAKVGLVQIPEPTSSS